MDSGRNALYCVFKSQAMMSTTKKRVPPKSIVLPFIITTMGFAVLFCQQSALRWQSTINKRAVERRKVNATLPGSYKSGEGIVCDRSHFRTDICTAFGHVQMHADSGLFLLDVQEKHNAGIEEKIRPYTRKWEKSTMTNLVREVTLKSVMFPNNLKCDVVHNVPAIVFSTGGFTGNLFHEFTDGIIPLYITSQHLEKEVVFINADCHNWWLTKYNEVLKQLTRYKVINLENETKIHCFPEVTAGFFFHGELMVDPALMLHNKSILDFRALLNQAYTPHWLVPGKSAEADRKPHLVIFVRVGSRMILNLKEVVELAEQIGFNVTIWKPLRTTELKTTYRLLNSSHVLLGVHGAALTHYLFMRPGSVFIQVIPLGIDWAAQTYFDEPSRRMGLHYIGYKIDIEESSLSNKYDRNNIVLTNPKAVVKGNWEATKEIYLESQDVILNLSRMRRILIFAKKKAKKMMNTL